MIMMREGKKKYDNLTLETGIGNQEGKQNMLVDSIYILNTLMHMPSLMFAPMPIWVSEKYFF